MEQLSITHRPRVISDIFAQPLVKRDLLARSKEDKWPKAMLFRGPYGTGKTTAAHIAAMNMQCSNRDADGNACGVCASCQSIISERFDRNTMMLDGSQLGQKDSVVEFTSMVNIQPMYDRRMVFIIEEADQLSGGAINALLKVLETPSTTAHFILLSMERGGIPPAIVSRCQTLDFKAVGVKDTMMALKAILEKETLWKSPDIPSEFFLEGLAVIAEASKGSLRTAVQYLDQALTGSYFTKDQLLELTASVDTVSTYKILDGLTQYSKDDNLWLSIFKADPAELYHYMTLVLSEVLIYKTTGYLNNEIHGHTTKQLASRPASEKLFKILNSSPQFSKPYIRSADILSALALFYLDAPQASTAEHVPIVITPLQRPVAGIRRPRNG
jgi:DNA polymerase III subunit gamma/tau